MKETEKNIKSGDFNIPKGHQPFMKVPKGGSSCANCKFLSEDKLHCVNHNFIKWHGKSELPTPIDEYCSDWYEPNESMYAKGGLLFDKYKKEYKADGSMFHPFDLRMEFPELIYNSFPTQKQIEKLNKWLRDNKEKYVKMYHGTPFDNKQKILEKGILPTTFSRRHSQQSESGYVYLSLFPTMSKLFADMANVYSKDNVVFVATILIMNLKPDTDQLNNKRINGQDLSIGDTLAESLIYGHGARVKGKVDRNTIRWIDENDIEYFGSGGKIPSLKNISDKDKKYIDMLLEYVYYNNPDEETDEFLPNESPDWIIRGSHEYLKNKGINKLYRGVQKSSYEGDDAFSWTYDIEVAKFFAKENGKILEKPLPKDVISIEFIFDWVNKQKNYLYSSGELSDYVHEFDGGESEVIIPKAGCNKSRIKTQTVKSKDVSGSGLIFNYETGEYYKKGGEFMNLKYSEIHHGYYKGQHNYTSYAKINDTIIGHVDYNIYENEIHIDLIEVDEKYRRQRVATKLLHFIRMNNPSMKIIWGYSTESGHKLYEYYSKKWISKKLYNGGLIDLTEYNGSDDDNKCMLSLYNAINDVKECKPFIDTNNNCVVFIFNDFVTADELLLFNNILNRLTICNNLFDVENGINFKEEKSVFINFIDKKINGGQILPMLIKYARIKPIREGGEERVVRVTPDAVGDYVAGYVIYYPAKSNHKVAYFSKYDFKNILDEGSYKLFKTLDEAEKSNLKKQSDADIEDTLKLRQRMRSLLKLLKYKTTDETGTTKEDRFIERVIGLIYDGKDFKSKLDIERIAENEFGFDDKRKVRELTEYAVLSVGRDIAKTYGNDIPLAYKKMVSLYSNQPYSTHRTATSVNLGQFSTPLPMSYLMGVYVGINKPSDKIYFEPTGGNGSMTVSGNVEDFVINELDMHRYNNLLKEPYKLVLNQDANKKFHFDYKFDGLLANPPFATTKNEIIADGFHISGLEQQIIVHSLTYLKNEAKIAFIIGGHTEFDEAGRIRSKKDRAFLSYLFKHYYMDDVINVNGSLYGRQGTTYPIRIILIAAKKSNPEGYYPLEDKNKGKFEAFSTKVIDSFDELFKRTEKYI